MASALDFPHLGLSWFLVEIFVFFTESDAHERASLSPVFHVTGLGSNYRANLAGRQQTLRLQPGEAGFQTLL